MPSSQLTAEKSQCLLGWPSSTYRTLETHADRRRAATNAIRESKTPSLTTIAKLVDAGPSDIARVDLAEVAHALCIELNDYTAAADVLNRQSVKNTSQGNVVRKLVFNSMLKMAQLRVASQYNTDFAKFLTGYLVARGIEASSIDLMQKLGLTVTNQYYKDAVLEPRQAAVQAAEHFTEEREIGAGMWDNFDHVSAMQSWLNDLCYILPSYLSCPFAASVCVAGHTDPPEPADAPYVASHLQAEAGPGRFRVFAVHSPGGRRQRGGAHHWAWR
jgi:hypothetical protein